MISSEGEQWDRDQIYPDQYIMQLLTMAHVKPHQQYPSIYRSIDLSIYLSINLILSKPVSSHLIPSHPI